jgi:hypothetical protein
MRSPEHYDALVQEAEATIIERIHAAGALSHVHCHGNVRSTIGKVVQRGADYFEPVEPPPDGDITMAEAKGIVAGRMTLGGNIESRILENEDTGTVEAATRAAFEGGKQRMVLETTAGPIARVTKRRVANCDRVLGVWEEGGAVGRGGRDHGPCILHGQDWEGSFPATTTSNSRVRSCPATQFGFCIAHLVFRVESIPRPPVIVGVQ